MINKANVIQVSTKGTGQQFQKYLKNSKNILKVRGSDGFLVLLGFLFALQDSSLNLKNNAQTFLFTFKNISDIKYPANAFQLCQGFLDLS